MTQGECSRGKQLFAGLFVVIGFMVLAPVVVDAQPYTFIQPGFTQEVYAVSAGFMGGVAFAPDGDVLVSPCAFSGGSLRRFDAQTTVPMSGSNIHPQVADLPSNAGCGLTNHPNGSLYTNTSGGVVRLNADTGVVISGPFGPAGNALGITPDPLTGELVYVGSSSNLIEAVNPALTTSRNFATLNAAEVGFVDGLFFDPTGQFLFLANRSPVFRLTIVDRNGNLVQHVPLPSEPDGIAFRATSPRFVLTNNLDGTISRIDFPGDDFTQTPTVSLFASGGFRGDLSQVGPDGCLYLTQDGVRFADGTTSSENSVVRICGGFATPPGVTLITLSPLTAVNPIGTTHTVTATVSRIAEMTKGGAQIQPVTFEILSGPNAGETYVEPLDQNLQASTTYLGDGGTGTDQIQAYIVDASGTRIFSNLVTKTWIGSATDCNNNGIPDDQETCPPVDLVFIMDTSGSMFDEAAGLCSSIQQVVADLAVQGITVTPSFLGITETPGGDFGCLTDNVANLLGGAVPGSSSCGSVIIQSEDWANATAVVAQNFPWTPGNVRLIIPISDEGPCSGDPCDDPGTDRDAITNAIAIANNNLVIVSPITGTGADSCVITLAQALADGTRGVTFQSTDPGVDFGQIIGDSIRDACGQATDCNSNGRPDSCDIADGISEDVNQNGVPDECEVRGGFKVLDIFGEVFNTGNPAPIINLNLDPPCAIAFACTDNGAGNIILEERGYLYPRGTIDPGFIGRDYGCKIARDVELTTTGDGVYVLSGFGTVDLYGDARFIGQTFFGTMYHPFDAARDLEFITDFIIDKSIALRTEVGEYILDGLGGIWNFGLAPHFGQAGFGFDIARAMEIAPDQAGYIVLDGFGLVHGFGSLAQVAFDLFFENPFLGRDLARDLEITPTGNGWHILDGMGRIYAVGDAQPINNEALESFFDIFVDLERGGSSTAPPPIERGAELILKDEDEAAELEAAIERAVRSPKPTVEEDQAPASESASAAGAGEDESSARATLVRHNGKRVTISNETREALAAKVIALVESCSGSREAVSSTSWREARNSDKALFVRFPDAVAARTADGEEVSFRAVVVPLAGDLHAVQGILLWNPKSDEEFVSVKGYGGDALSSLISTVEK
ncbi:MAG: hypothetical protein HUU16_09105 [Candidatus Omnitrophica bacterium]|nr:hypothetical protein [Candidatus Omnitrophota bacterium]